MSVELIKIDDIVDVLFELRVKKEDGDLKSLKDSIMQAGQIHPIMVRRKGDKYELIAGSRRLKAMKEAGQEYISAQVVELSDLDSFRYAMSENIHRKDLTPGEVIIALKEASKQFSIGVEALLDQLNIGKTQKYVYLKLMDTDDEIIDALVKGEISLNVAYEIAKVPSRTFRLRYLDFAVKDGATPGLIQSWRQQEHSMINEEAARELGIEVPKGEEAEVKKESRASNEEEIAVPVQLEPNLYADRFVCMVDGGSYPQEKKKTVIMCEACYNILMKTLEETR